MPTLFSSLSHRVADAARAFASARRVAAAVDAGRPPAARDLDRLGIDPAAFAAIRTG